MPEISKIVGISLRKLRVSKKYSQQYVADYLEISRNAYMNWEAGKTNLSINQVQAICSFYHIRLSTFIEDYVERDMRFNELKGGLIVRQFPMHPLSN